MRKTQRLVNKLIVELERTGIPLNACSKVGVSRSTYYRWRQDDFDFKIRSDEAIRIGRENVSDLAESKLVKNISEGNQRAIEFQLRHNDPRYQEFKYVELTRLLNQRSQAIEEDRLLFRGLIDEVYEIIGLDGLRKLAGKDSAKDNIGHQDRAEIEAEARKLMSSQVVQSILDAELKRINELQTTPNNSEEDTVQ